MTTVRFNASLHLAKSSISTKQMFQSKTQKYISHFFHPPLTLPFFPSLFFPFFHLFDCCKQSLTWLQHPSTHPSIHPSIQCHTFLHKKGATAKLLYEFDPLLCKRQNRWGPVSFLFYFFKLLKIFNFKRLAQMLKPSTQMLIVFNFKWDSEYKWERGYRGIKLKFNWLILRYPILRKFCQDGDANQRSNKMAWLVIEHWRVYELGRWAPIILKCIKNILFSILSTV